MLLCPGDSSEIFSSWPETAEEKQQCSLHTWFFNRSIGSSQSCDSDMQTQCTPRSSFFMLKFVSVAFFSLSLKAQRWGEATGFATCPVIKSYFCILA